MCCVLYVSLSGCRICDLFCRCCVLCSFLPLRRHRYHTYSLAFLCLCFVHRMCLFLFFSASAPAPAPAPASAPFHFISFLLPPIPSRSIPSIEQQNITFVITHSPLSCIRCLPNHPLVHRRRILFVALAIASPSHRHRIAIAVHQFFEFVHQFLSFMSRSYVKQIG